jgi:hypothetical protein
MRSKLQESEHSLKGRQLKSIRKKVNNNNTPTQYYELQPQLQEYKSKHIQASGNNFRLMIHLKIH